MNKRIYYTILLVVPLMLFGFSDIVSAICNVSTTPVSFGNYSVLSSAPLDAEGTITVSCDERPRPRVTISIGSSPNSGGFDPRVMKRSGGSDQLSYNLFIDSTRTEIWGDGSGNTFTQTKTVSSKPRESVVYSRIPPGQDVSVGNYSDTLTVIITW